MRRSKILATAALALSMLCAAPLHAQSPEGAAQPYVVRKGDTLSAISKQFYGKTTLGQKLWQANRNLVSHPERLTPGDTLYIFPESTLNAQKNTMMPPPPLPEAPPAPLYQSARPMNASFPKYFNFLADGRGLGGSGAIRIRVKNTDPNTGQFNDTLCEVREVGEIVATDERGAMIFGDGADKASIPGSTLLSTNDEVMVRFTEDLAKILDSDTYGEADPYFREFPIYGVGETAQVTNRNRVDKFNSIGELYHYKGKLTIIARVEGLAPISGWEARTLKRKRGAKNQDMEPVVYLARINYAEDAIQIQDRVFLFNPLEPGPERQIEAPFVEEPNSYNSLGN